MLVKRHFGCTPFYPLPDRRGSVAAAGRIFLKWSAPTVYLPATELLHRTIAGWREESFEDLHPRGSGSGYDEMTDLLIT